MTLVGALCALLLLVATSSASAQERPMSKRFGATVSGDLRLIGNTTMTCDAARTTDCLDARAGQAVTSQNNNNAHFMTYIDVDGDSSTFSSSSARLTLPATARVLWAGLYWGGNLARGTDGQPALDAAARATVRLKGPGQPAYQAISSPQCDSRGQDYQCVADITARVVASGEYTVADVQSGTGKGQYGGWGLIVAFEDAAEPVRDLSVFDGYLYISSTNSTVDVPVSGFLTPPSGPVRSRVGLIGYEGDLNATGDSMRLAGQALSDGLNPTSNVFNSSNTMLGQRQTDTTPHYPNQLGFDVDLIEADGLIPNNATSTVITLRTGGETYFAGAVTLATRIYAPQIEVAKTVRPLQGPDFEPGQQVEYQLVVTNEGFDAAEQLVLSDELPMTLTYVPGSITLDGVAQTDAQDMDRARFDAASQRVIVHLGAGATAAQGGRLARGDMPTRVTFRAQLAATLRSGDQVVNQARATYRAATLGLEFASLSDANAALMMRSPTLFTVDQTPPMVVIVSPTEDQRLGQARPTLVIKTEPGARVSWSLSQSAGQSQGVADAQGDLSWTPSAALPEGTYVLTVTSTDAAGNSAQAMRAFVIDLTPPAIALTQPPDGATLRDPRPRVIGQTEPLAQVRLEIDGGPPTTLTADAQGQFSFQPARDLSDGPHTVLATATDAAGNTGSASSTFTLSTRAPRLTIDEPANGSHVNTRSPTILGQSEPLAQVRLSLDGAPAIPITADAQGRFRWPVPSPLDEGAHQVTAQTQDAAGNQANTSSVFTVDTLAPVLTIETPSPGQVVALRRPTLSGRADAGAQVALTLQGQLLATVQADERSQWSFSPRMDLADGDYTLVAMATDRAGNQAQATRDFTVLIQAPGMVVITSPLDGATLNSRSDRLIRGRASPGLTVTLTADGVPIGQAQTQANGQWSALPMPPLMDGQHTIQAATSEASAQITIWLDTQGPSLTLLTPQDGERPASNPPLISGQTDPQTQVTIFINGQRQVTVMADEQGRFRWQPEQALSDGDHLIAARAQDPEGNTTLVEHTILYERGAVYVATGGACAAAPARRAPSPLMPWLGVLLAGAARLDLRPRSLGSLDVRALASLSACWRAWRDPWRRSPSHSGA